MNFTRLSTLILVLFTTHFASAESLCHQPYQGEPNLLVKDQVRFPGHGKICADQVCVTSDLKTLQTTLPARTEKVCVAFSWDHNDSTAPKKVCHEYEVQELPALVLSTPVLVATEVCLESHPNWNDSTLPHICTKWETKEVQQKLSYELLRYPVGDYRREQDPSRQVVNYPPCPSL